MFQSLVLQFDHKLYVNWQNGRGLALKYDYGINIQ